MTTLDTRPRLDDPDLAFESLVEAHRDLTAEQSRRFDARLVLLLANHIGSVTVLRAAITAARATAWEPAEAPPAGEAAASQTGPATMRLASARAPRS